MSVKFRGNPKKGLIGQKGAKMSKRGDRIITRQKQCGTCEFEGSEETGEKSYGYCTLKKKRFCEMNIWKDCKDYKPRKEQK